MEPMAKPTQDDHLRVRDKQALRRARRFLAETHWGKHSYGSYIGNKEVVCLVGAVRLGVTGTPWRADHPAVHRIIKALKRAIKTREGYVKAPHVERWNDRRKTKLEDVLAVIDMTLEEG
jgi:hypothetical protein